MMQGFLIFAAILTVAFIAVGFLCPPMEEYNPHNDPTFMPYHEPEYCPVCRARRNH